MAKQDQIHSCGAKSGYRRYDRLPTYCYGRTSVVACVCSVSEFSHLSASCCLQSGECVAVVCPMLLHLSARSLSLTGLLLLHLSARLLSFKSSIVALVCQVLGLGLHEDSSTLVTPVSLSIQSAAPAPSSIDVLLNQ